MGQTSDGAQTARLRRLHSLIFRAGINADLLGLFLPNLFPLAAGQQVFHPQAPAGNFQISQPDSLRVPRNLIDLGGKFRRINGGPGIGLQALEQLVHPVQPQSGAKIAGKQLPPGDHLSNALQAHRPLLQIFFHSLFAAQGQIFHPIFPRIRAKIHAGRIQLPAQFLQQRPSAVGR